MERLLPESSYGRTGSAGSGPSVGHRAAAPRSVILVACVDLRVVAALDKALDRVGVVAGASVYPLVWNILLAARNEGFGGTITTMVIAEEPTLKGLLGIPEPFAVAAVVPLGRPVKQVKRLSRVAVAELTHLEHWNGGPLRA